MSDSSTLHDVAEQQRDLIQTAQAALSGAFGIGFDLWYRDGAWVVVSAAEQRPARNCPADEEGLTALLDAAAADHGETQVAELSAGRFRLALPIRRLGKVVMVATADLESESSELVERLASLFLREFSQRQQIQRHQDDLEAHYAQISDDFEELTFLRTMTEHMELTKITSDLLDMAETALPLLRQSVKAETAAMVLVQADDADVLETSLTNENSTIVWVGLEEISEEVCRDLVERFRIDAEKQPVVRNRYDEDVEGTTLPGVRDFVLVPISKGTRRMGWLLALNRVFRRGIDGAGLRSQLSQFEFGTGEAGLLSSAASMLATQAHNVELFREKEKLLINVVRAMVSAIEAKDPYTCGHSERVALYAERLGRSLGLDEEHCERLYLTGLLHDVGKIGIRDATLGKPSRLTDEEFQEIKQHTELGWAILHDLGQLRYVLPGVVHHHERIDGMGYPDGLVGDAIPLEGRILAVADTYDAMTSDRPYRKGMGQEKAEEILRGGAGTQWDAKIIETFLRIRDEIVHIRKSYRRPSQPTRQPSDTNSGTSVATLSLGNTNKSCETPSPK